MISEDYLHLGDSGLCMSPLSQRGVPNGSPLRDRSEMGLLMACDLWAHEDSDNGEDLMMHSQAHLLDVHDGGADSTAAGSFCCCCSSSAGFPAVSAVASDAIPHLLF